MYTHTHTHTHTLLIKANELLVVSVECPEEGEVLLRLVQLWVGGWGDVEQALHGPQ